jgi:hypothetical protein
VAAGASPASSARKWWLGELARRANEAGVDLAGLAITPAQVARVQALVDAGTLNDKLARSGVRGRARRRGGPGRRRGRTRAGRGLRRRGARRRPSTPSSPPTPDVADKIRDGKVQAAGALIGAVMKAMRGQADAARVRELILSVWPDMRVQQPRLADWVLVVVTVGLQLWALYAPSLPDLGTSWVPVRRQDRPRHRLRPGDVGPVAGPGSAPGDGADGDPARGQRGRAGPVPARPFGDVWDAAADRSASLWAGGRGARQPARTATATPRRERAPRPKLATPLPATVERSLMELREDAQWSLVVPTSMGVRITPENRAPVHTSDRFFLQATSAETNVATVVSYLGEPAKVLTAFVEGSPISALIKADLRKRNMAYEGKDLPQGDAWGLPPPVQHRRLRLRRPRPARVERPRGRGRPRPGAGPVRPRSSLRRRGRQDPAPVRPDRRAEPVHLEVLRRARQGGEGARHARGDGPQLPRHLLEGPRGGAVRRVRRDRQELRHPLRQRGGLPALPRHRGPRGRRRVDR